MNPSNRIGYQPEYITAVGFPVQLKQPVLPKNRFLLTGPGLPFFSLAVRVLSDYTILIISGDELEDIHRIHLWILELDFMAHRSFRHGSACVPPQFFYSDVRLSAQFGHPRYECPLVLTSGGLLLFRPVLFRRKRKRKRLWLRMKIHLGERIYAGIT